MLGMRSYSQDYVDASRRRVDTQVAAYRALAAAGGRPVEDELAGVAPTIFNALVLALEAAFVHRLRVVEGKDGNPLNEVRVLATSLLEHDGVLTIDKSLKLKPESSVLGLRPGDQIALDETAFVKLAEAFFTEIETRFVDPDS